MYHHGGMDEHVVLGEYHIKSFFPGTVMIVALCVKICCTFWQLTLFVQALGSVQPSIANNNKDTGQ